MPFWIGRFESYFKHLPKLWREGKRDSFVETFGGTRSDGTIVKILKITDDLKLAKPGEPYYTSKFYYRPTLKMTLKKIKEARNTE